MKSFVYIGVFLLLRATTCQNDYVEYDLLVPIMASSSDTETNGIDSFPAWPLNRENHINVPLDNLSIKDNQITIPFVIDAMFKLEELKRTCLFYIKDTKGVIKLALCLSPADTIGTRVTLESDTIKGFSETFTVDYMRNNWTHLVLHIEESQMTLSSNCSLPETSMSSEPLMSAIDLGNNSRLYLGYDGDGITWHPFKGVVQQLKLITNVDQIGVDGLCLTDELPSSEFDPVNDGETPPENIMGFLGESPPPPISPPPHPGSCECSPDMVSQILETNKELKGLPGQNGSSGPIGPKGSRGDQGHKGEPGIMGTKGDTGEKGDVGPKGDIGSRGEPGKDGTPGLNGPPGPPGPVIKEIKGANEVIMPAEKGERGSPGPKGPPGTEGLNGTKGETGSQGVAGKKGDQGECSRDMVSQVLGTMKDLRGPPGESGTIGLTGPKGPRGDQGDQGEEGKTGPKGDTGQKGDIGPQGDLGAKGDPGKDGAKGSQGLPGPPGPVLEQIKGVNEVIIPAEKGETGSPGLQGPPGSKGLDGSKGEKGTQGIKGEKGDEGHKGDQGPSGKRGDRGDRGDSGTQGPRGLTGDRGEKGDRGLPGTPGESAKLSSLLDPETDRIVVEAIVQKLRGVEGKQGKSGIKGDKGEPGPPGTIVVQDRKETTTVVAPEKGEKGQIGEGGKPGPSGSTGPAGKSGPRGPPGPKGPRGATGSTGPRGPAGPRGDKGPAGEKGAKGDHSSPIDLTKVKGEKGDRGDPGPLGPTGHPGPPGNKAEGHYLPVPGPPGPPGPPGAPGVSLVGPKGEPGDFVSQKTVYTMPHGKRSPNDVSDDDEGIMSGTVIYKTTTALRRRTRETPVGTLAYVIREKTLLLRIEDGWQYVVMGSILETRDPEAIQNVYHPPAKLPYSSARPPLQRVSNLRNANLERGYIRLAALNTPYAGNMFSPGRTGTLAANNECYKRSRKEHGTFVAFLASSIQDLESLVKSSDRHLPVINLHEDVMFTSWASVFDGSEGPWDVSKTPLYSFSGRNILIDPTWPQKAVWHGGNRNGTHGAASCGEWRDNGRDQHGLASSLLSFKLLEQKMYSCDNQLIVLCVEVSRSHSIKDPRRHALSKRRAYNMHHHRHSHGGLNNVTSVWP